MMAELRNFLDVLINNSPSCVYELLLIMFCLGVVLIVIFKSEAVKRNLAKLLLIEYIALIYCSTVICRNVSVERKFDYTPFWSYNKENLLVENIMNVWIFIPIGLLLGAAIIHPRWVKVLAIGCGISISIEFLQLALKRGFSEVDDVMHNMLGCMVGFGLYRLSSLCIQKLKCIKCRNK